MKAHFKNLSLAASLCLSASLVGCSTEEVPPPATDAPVVTPAPAVTPTETPKPVETPAPAAETPAPAPVETPKA